MSYTPSPEANEQTGWVGWIVFGATMMMIVGGFQAIEGLGAIFKDQIFVPTENLIISVDITAWGWIHLLLGIITVLTGIGLLFGQTWARAVGTIVISVSILANFAFLPAYPFWSMTLIALGGFVLYAILVHGREMRSI